MHRMIRRISTLLFALAIALFLAVPAPDGAAWLLGMPRAMAAEQEELVQIQITAVPEELVEPGDISLTFTISNISDTDAQNVYLSSSDGLLSEPVGRIAAGESQTFSRTHSVSQDELDEGKITYTVSHDDPADADAKVNYVAQADIRCSAMQPRLEFTRQISHRKIAAGGTATITYRIRNTGNMALTGLLVEDDLGNYTGRVEHLDVNESRTLISRVTLTEDAVSTASLTYTVDALEQTFVETLAELPIQIAESRINASLSANYSAFSTNTADVMLVMRNTGSAACRDVRVIDDIYGGVIADELYIPADGIPVEVSRSYPLRSNEGFRWRITGVSETGENISISTETVKLEPRQPADISNVNVYMQALTPRIRRSGEVGVRMVIENAGDADITDVLLAEDNLGEVHRFAIVPAGGSLEREIRLDVKETTAYNFHLQYADAEGMQQAVECDPVEITLAADGVLPEGVQPRFIEFTGNSIKIGGSSMFAVLLIAGCVVLAVLVIILLIASRRARLEKHIRIAAERQKRRAEAAHKKGRHAARKPKK